MTANDALSLTVFEKATWFPQTNLVAEIVPEGRSPNDPGERMLAARECLLHIARDSRDDSMPWLVLLGAVRGHPLRKAHYDLREAEAMRLLRLKDTKWFRYTIKPRWEQQVALVLLAELRDAGD